MAATHHAIMGRAPTSRVVARELVTLGAVTAATLALPLLIIVSLLSEPLDRLFHASGLLPVALLGPLLAVVVGQQIVSGALLGAERFSAQGITTLTDAAVRALVTYPAAILFGVTGSLTAYLVGQIAAIAVAVTALGGFAWFRLSPRDLEVSGRLGLASVSLVLGTALLQNGDLVALRWYGEPTDAGLYAACASVGTLLAAISVPIYLPSFPRALAATRARRRTRPILLTTLALVLGLAATAALGSLWLGAPVLRLSFGTPFAAARHTSAPLPCEDRPGCRGRRHRAARTGGRPWSCRWHRPAVFDRRNGSRAGCATGSVRPRLHCRRNRGSARQRAGVRRGPRRCSAMSSRYRCYFRRSSSTRTDRSACSMMPVNTDSVPTMHSITVIKAIPIASCRVCS